MSRRPRLADWGEYAAAVYEVMGWGEETFLEDWNEVVKAQNVGTLDGSPVAQVIIELVREHGNYEGSATDLHNKLEGIAEDVGVNVARDKAWPKSARWLWRRINEVLPLLLAVGIEASRRHTDKGTTIALRETPTDDVSDVSRDESSIGKAKSPDNTDEGNVRSNVRSGSNVSENSAYLSASDNTDNRFGDFSEGPLSNVLKPGESATLGELKARREGQAASATETLDPLLSRCPDWLRNQARKRLEEGSSQRLLKPLASPIASEYLGDIRRWEEALPFVREHVEELAR